MSLQTVTVTTYVPSSSSRIPRVHLTVVEESTSVANNTSHLTYTVWLERKSSYTPTATKTATWTIGDYSDSWTGKLTGSGTSSMTFATGSLDVVHNTDGTKTINLADSFTLNTSWDGVSYTTLNGSGSMTLTAIPRYGTVTQSVNSKTETSIKMNWTSDSTVDYIWYSSNNGSSWTGLDVTDGTSGTYTISGLTANTAYNIKTRIRRKDSQLTTDSSALSVTTYNYPYASSMPNFTIGNKLTLGFYNPLGRTFTFYIIANGTQIASSWSISGTSYSGVDADSSKNQLYATIPNAKSATYQVKCVYSSSTITKTGGTYTVPSTAVPTVTGLTYQDTASAVVAITGNNQKIVQNKSTVRYTASGVSATNSATISSVKVAVNGNTYTLSVSGSNYVGGNATINSGSNVTAKVTVTDSRGMTATKSVTVQMIAYSNPSAIIKAWRTNNFYDTSHILVDESHTIIGSNACTISFQYKQSGTSTWSTAVTLTDNTQYDFTADNQYAFDLKVVLTDSFGSTTTYNLTLNRGVPIIFFDRELNSIGLHKLPTYSDSFESVVPYRLDDPQSSYGLIMRRTDMSGTYKTAYIGIAQNTVTGYSLNFGVGSNGIQRGIWDRQNSSVSGHTNGWMIYMDGDLDTVKIPHLLQMAGLTESVLANQDTTIRITPMWKNADLGLTTSTSNPKSYTQAWCKKVIQTFGQPDSTHPTIFMGRTMGNTRGFIIWTPYEGTTYVDNEPMYSVGFYVLYSHYIYTISHESYTFRMFAPTLTEYNP